MNSQNFIFNLDFFFYEYNIGIATFTKEHDYVMSKYATNYIEKVDCIEKLKSEIPLKHLVINLFSPIQNEFFKQSF